MKLSLLVKKTRVKLRSFIDFFGLILFKTIFLFIDYLPKQLGKFICLVLVKLIVLLIPRSKYVMHRNLQLLFPTMSTKERREIIKKHKIVLAENIYGFSQSKFLTKENVKEVLDVTEIEDTINEIINNKTGVGYLFLIPHFGCFELFGQAWSLYDRPYSILARGFNLPFIDGWWNKRREINGNQIFGRKGGFSEVTKRLSRGDNVAILFDQNVKRSHGMFVPFFGIEASTTKTLALASLRTGCQVVLSVVLPVSDTKYKLIVKKIKRPQDREGDQDQQVRETIVDANLALEELVKEYPEQWFLMHRRFKTRPLGENENFYDEVLYPVDR